MFTILPDQLQRQYLHSFNGSMEVVTVREPSIIAAPQLHVGLLGGAEQAFKQTVIWLNYLSVCSLI